MDENFLSIDKASKEEIRFIFFKDCKETNQAATLSQHAIVAAYKNNKAALETVFEFYTQHPGCLNNLFLFYKDLLDKKRKDFVIQFIKELTNRIFEFYKIDYKKDFIDSSYETNLPFLRTMFYLGTLYHTSQNLKMAVDIYEKLIILDPEDLIGTRYALIKIYLKMGWYKRILQLCNRYPDDETPIIMYAHVLALIKEKEIEKAKVTLKEAIRLHPLIALNLLTNSVGSKEIEKNKKFILQGGEYEASLYMRYYNEFWDDEAKEILKEFKDEILTLSEKRKKELLNEKEILDALD